MLLHYYLTVTVALCCEVSAGPCRPHSSSSIATSFSTGHTDDLTSSTSLSTLSSVELEATTVLESIATISFSTSLVVPSDSTLAKSSASTSADDLSVSIDPTALGSTSVVFSSVTTGAYSDTQTSDAAPTTTITSGETAASPTTSDYQSSTLDQTTVTYSTALDTTTTSTDASFPTTEINETPLPQITSSSRDISSDQTSAGAETSTAEIASIKSSTASTKEETTTTSTTSAEPIQPTNYFVNGGFEIPNDAGEYTGTPSLLGRDVKVKSDPIQALSGTHYAELALPPTGAYVFRQSLTGLDPAKRYAYTYNWATNDMIAFNEFNAYLRFTTYIGNSAYELDFRGEIGPENRYVKRKIVFSGSSFGRNTATAADVVQTRVQAISITSGSIRFDDVSIFEYDPPCVLLNPTPENKWCGLKGSAYSLNQEDKTIGKEQSLSLEDCLQSCHLEPTCQIISYVPAVGNNLGRCWRFKVPREDIKYIANTGGHVVYEPGCFSFKE
ncbi:hypothetical protein HG530_001636 [Fusarium avenaceum]|nr:hypothetical protein HG530_001636 [Fusarium avenaceum]